MCASLQQRKQQTILALTIQTWHVHLIVGATAVGIDDIVKGAKDAGRYHLRLGRPLWTEGYDKRFCFDLDALKQRVAYVERHNERFGWPPRPWAGIVSLEEYLNPNRTGLI